MNASIRPLAAAGVAAIATAAVDACPPDTNDDGWVNGDDLLNLILNLGPCSGCAEDLNGDGMVDQIDIAYVVESWGACPSAIPGSVERFDEVVVVDATDLQAQALGLVVTHVYATGDDVAEGDALVLAGFSDIQAAGTTTFFQEPLFGDNVPPSSSNVTLEPALEYDTFVSIGALVDDDHTILAPGFEMDHGSVSGGWLAGVTTHREAAYVEPIGKNAVLIAQITLEKASALEPGYAGAITLFTSTHDGGSLTGIDAEFSFIDELPVGGSPDVNGDGFVDVADLVIVITSWGTAGPGDVDGDGVVGVTDLTEIILNWGSAP